MKAIPTIVCLCGSTRFKDAFTQAQFDETLAGNIVLTIGCNLRTDQELFGAMPHLEFDAVKMRLDALHLRKIELADEVLILNVGGYVGTSTRGELKHAIRCGKRVRWLEPDKSADEDAHARFFIADELTRGLQESFQHAVRHDSDMTPEQKARWLDR